MGRVRTAIRALVGRARDAWSAAGLRGPGAGPEAGPATPRPAAAPSTAPAARASLDAGAQEVLERLGAGERVVLLDVRDAAEREDGVIPGARFIPLGALETRRAELDGCDEIVCYCTSGVRSRDAARILRALGLFNATSLAGGIGAWTAAGGSLVVPSTQG
ncbi:MAG: hypothetical protein RLZZ299_2957 [Pseudomonadota bacterium]|jgi:rhodanese-related sulfurtransferase